VLILVVGEMKLNTNHGKTESTEKHGEDRKANAFHTNEHR
jgi:hypothetical protein